MATGRALITDALLDIGIGALGEELHQSIMNRALNIGNRMLSKWSADTGVVDSVLDELTWTSGSQSMTIGTGGDLNTTRPIEITGFQSRKSTLDYTLTQVSFEQYQTTILKSTSTDYPDVFAYQNTYPLGTLYLYPVPASNLSIRIQSKKPLSLITLDDDVSWPSGWEEAFQTNLSVRSAPAFGKSARRELFSFAKEALDIIKDANEDNEEMWPDSMLPGINSGDNIDILTNR